MYQRKTSTVSDILSVLADGQVYTLQEIADKVEIGWATAQRHVQSLSFSHPIYTFTGGDKKGAVYLDRYEFLKMILPKQDMQVLCEGLGMLQQTELGQEKAQRVESLQNALMPKQR